MKITAPFRPAHVTAAAVVMLSLTACAGSHDDGSVAADARAHQSDQVMEFNAYAPNEPGCSAAVGVDGGVVWRGVQGLADLRTRSPITAATTFNLGSVSKQFTATAILLLADDNDLRLSDPLAKYVEGLPRWAGQVTVEELLHHTSGIPDYLDLLGRAGYHIEKSTSQEQAVAVVASENTLRFPPGTKWEYS